jgi:gamma-glutamyltranspeptidase/glutathione hydrolase
MRKIEGQPGFAENFLPVGSASAVGETDRNLALAVTLEAIAERRAWALYEENLAHRIVANAKRHGAVLSEADLAGYSPERCGTIAAPFYGTELREIPPNGHGIVATMAAAMLEHTDIADRAPDSVAGMHLQTEAIKLAISDAERFVSDPATMHFTPNALLEPGYLAERARLIDRARAGDPGVGAPKAGGHGLPVRSGCVGHDDLVHPVELFRLGLWCGHPRYRYPPAEPRVGLHAREGPSERGRTVQSALAYDHPRSSHAGRLARNELSRDGRTDAGAGPCVRTVLHGQSPQAACDALRWRFSEGRGLAVEWSMPTDIVDGLAALGHGITREAPDNVFGFGGAQPVMRYGDGYVAGSDHRTDGMAIGF